MTERNWIVYKHTNLSNQKVYIGITHNIKERWRGNGCAYMSNRHFWQAIQKYGWDGFSHEILFENLSHEEACELEVKLIAQYDAKNRLHGYNKSPGGDSPLVIYYGKDHHFYGKHLSEEHRKKLSESHSGEKHYCYGKHLPEETRQKIGDANRGHSVSEEQREKLRQANLGKKASQETRQKMSLAQKGRVRDESIGQKISDAKAKKEVVQMSLSGEVIRVWPSVSMAASENNVASGSICKCCKGALHSSGGFTWAYLDGMDCQKIIPISEEQRKTLIEAGTRIGNAKQRKQVLQLTRTGELVKVWPSLTQAAKENNMVVSAITRCCKGIVQTSGGYVWRYAEEYGVTVEEIPIFRERHLE